jgi:glucosamine--fructose-6-phosphate aminotransferase (isomerizing)
MCGIIGVVALQESKKLAEITVNALRKLEYRGYDSVGVAAVSSSGIEIRKAKGKVEEVVRSKRIPELSGYIMLGHTRWATHGPPSDRNAHPHSDCKGEVAVVHNGTIKNYRELREELESLGHKFSSETDTEVIPHLIEEFMKRGMNPFEAFKAAVRAIQGSYAVLAVIKGERRIFFAKKDNPLVIGLGNGMNFVASDIPAFLDATNKVIVLKDGELGYVTPEEVYIETLNGEPVDAKSRVLTVNWKSESVSKGGYPHYMLKEIHESPVAAEDTINGLKSDREVLQKAVKMLSDAGRIIIVASGTSFHAGLYFHELLLSEGFNSLALIASEYYTVKASPSDVVVAVSQSGETLDVIQAVKSFKAKGAQVISLTNVIGSALARESDVALYMRAGPEIGVAATKTFTSQLASFALIYSELTGTMKDEINKVRSVIERSIEAYEGLTKEWGEALAKKDNAYYLGRGLGVPLAMEGALKIKEIAYIHAEAYPAGESKHGPIALVTQGFPVFIINVDKGDLLLNNLAEMKARGAETYAVSANMKLGADHEIILDVSEFLAPFGVAPIIQLVSYYAAVTRGHDPDKPRNLAKTVTVE